jgi:hypothetical protein
VNDFDQNGSLEPIMTSQIDGKEYPVGMRQDIIKQMSSLKKKFVYYKDFAIKSMEDIFDKPILDQSVVHKSYESKSLVLLNSGNGSFAKIPLPVPAQVSPVYAITASDFNGDGTVDILLGGNLYAVKPEVGRYDALHGLLLLGNGEGNFTAVSSMQSGIKLEGETRHIKQLGIGNNKLIYLVARNNNEIKLLKPK